MHSPTPAALPPRSSGRSIRWSGSLAVALLGLFLLSSLPSAFSGPSPATTAPLASGSQGPGAATASGVSSVDAVPATPYCSTHVRNDLGCLGMPGTSVHSSTSSPLSGWSELGAPPARVFSMSAPDLATGYTVVFGGNGTHGYLGDTWEVTYSFNGNPYVSGDWAHWTQVPTTTAPSARMAGAMAYDAADQTVVLFGGYDGGYLGDTWVFQAGTWTELSPTSSPSPRAYASMTWDDQLGEIVLFGGKDATTTFNDTWTYSDGTWTELPLTHAPTPRYGAAFTGDAVDTYDLLFGGSNGSAETWEFKGSAWTQVFPGTSPPAREFASVAYNGGSPSLYLMGGYNGAPLGDSWSWASGDWSCQDCSGNGPSPRYGALASDLPLGSHPLFATGSSVGNDSWVNSGANWFPLAPAYGQGVDSPPPYAPWMDSAYDPLTDQFVVEGGNLPGGYWTDTWAFEAGNWSDLNLNTPNNLNRNAGTMVWDGADSALLYFGGWNGGPLNDTWQFTGTSWVSVATNHGPSARYGAGMVYDPVDGYVLLFGGSNSVNDPNYLSDTWAYRAGVWTNITATAGPAPPASVYPAMTWDAETKQVVLFGGVGPDPQNETWSFQQGRWTQLHPLVSPSARDGEGLVYDDATGEVYAFGGYDGSSLGDLWSFSHDNWTEVASATPAGTLSYPDVAYDVATDQVVIWGGETGNPNNWDAATPDYNQNTWTWSPKVAPLALSVVANVTASDGAATVGFTGVASGGVTPYTTTWVFGDGGAASTPVASHRYTTPGAYTARLFLNDSVGQSISRTWNVTINGALTLAPVATPMKVIVGSPVIFTSGLQGGTAPISLSWDFGDGSSGSAALDPRHTYNATGNETVSVTAVDALSKLVTATITVEVVAGPLTADVYALPPIGDAPLVVSFSSFVSGGIPPYAVFWSFGDGHDSNASDPTHNYTASGSYLVKFYAADSQGDYRVRYLNVTALTPQPLTAQPIESTSQGMAPLNVSFSAIPSGGSGTGYTFTWNFGDGAVGSGSAPTHEYTQPGLYTPTVLLSDSAGDAATKALPPITITATSGLAGMQVHAYAVPEPGQSPTAVAFTGSVSGGTPPYFYAWSFGDGGTSTSPSPSHVYPTPGPYTATVNVTDSSVPSEHAESTVLVNVGNATADGLQLAVAANPPSGDSPLTVSFAVVAEGGSQVYTDYQWSFGDGQTATGPYATHTYVTAGRYPVHVYVTDTNGDNASDNLSVTVKTATVAVAIHPTSTSGSAPFYLVLQASASGGTGQDFRYNWTFGDGSGATGSAVSHTYASPGKYTITLTATDSGGNTGSTTLTIVVSPSSTVGFLGLPDEAWFIIAPLAAVVGLMAAVLFLALRRPMVLATKKEEEEAPPPLGELPPWPETPLTLVETTDETAVFTLVAPVPKEDLLVVTRGATDDWVKERGYSASQVWQLSVTEGENSVRPADLEKIGHVVEQHLSSGKGKAAVLTGTDMLLDATSLKAVRRLLAVFREVAQEHGGRVLVVANVRSLSKEDKAHLEEGAQVLRH